MSKPTTFVVNAFQTPNGYVDEVMPYLTGEEFKVLVYATRRILGFQKRQDRISVSQFTNGTTNKDGEVLDSGTGLSNETVKNCLANLVEFGLMVRVAENDPTTNEGTLWSLQWNGDKVNWSALEKREDKKRKSFTAKMKKARSMRQTPPNGIERGWGNGIERTPPNGIETQKTEERQGNTDGDKSPLKTNELPIEWQLLAGVEKVTLPDETQARRRDAANLIATGFGANFAAAYELVMAFQNERDITFTESDIKGQRKAVKAMLEKNVKPNHVQEAVKKLKEIKYTFVDLFGVIKTAVDLATKPDEQIEYTRYL